MTNLRNNSTAARIGVRLVGVVVGFLTLAGLAFGVRALRGSDGPVRATTPSPYSTTSTSAGSSASAVTPVRPVSAAQRAALPKSTTFSTVRGLPQLPDVDSDGRVVRIAGDQVGFSAPGGLPATVIPGTQLGLDTWLPIIDRRPGWLQVRLPSRPNGSVTWVPAAGYAPRGPIGGSGSTLAQAR